jgi:hypothetical protein
MLAAHIHLLQQQVDPGSERAEELIVYDEPVELVSVDGQALMRPELPGVLLVNAHSDQMRHHMSEPAVVVPFHPYDFDPTLGVRELSNVGEQPPVVFLEPGKIKITKDVAQQDQAPEGILFQHPHRIFGAAEV